MKGSITAERMKRNPPPLISPSAVYIFVWFHLWGYYSALLLLLLLQSED